MELKDKKCDCSTKNVQKLTQEGIEELLQKVEGWKVDDDLYLIKKYTFPDYKSGFQFLTEVVRIAEEQNHHPDFSFTAKNKLTLTIYTYVVNGLTENDFILAAKYDAIQR